MASDNSELSGDGDDGATESQLNAAPAQEQSCKRTLQILGLTAGGSGWESSVAITTNASRNQMVNRIDFIYADAPKDIVADIWMGRSWTAAWG